MATVEKPTTQDFAAGSAFLTQVVAARRRYQDRSGQRDQTLRTLERRGVLHADTPERVTKRLARLGVDWSLATALEQTPPRPATGRSLGETLAPDRFGPDVLGLERLMGRNDMIPVSFLEAGFLASRSIGRITVRGQQSHVGTGFMVSPSLLMTNNHVLRDAEEAGRGFVEFNVQAGLDGTALAPVAFEFEPGRFFRTDEELDFSLVAVAPHNKSGARLSSFGWLRLTQAQGQVVLGELVNIVQHPDGEPKQLALRENKLVDLLDTFLHYEADTMQGSSGSPVFNDQWEVVALHHAGVPLTDDSGRMLALDGTPWTPDLGEQRLAWKANEGVRISRILALVREMPLTGTEAALREELFTAAADPAAVTGAEAGPRVTGVDGRPPVAHEVSAALVNAEAGRGRPYLDRAGDRAAAEAYYAGLAPSGPVTRRALTELLQATHERRPAYKPMRLLYPWVDLHPDRRLRGIYSGLTFTPEELIRADAAVETARIQRWQELLLREGEPGPERLEAELESLAATLPFNCEHVVPQSWFAKAEPMRGDLHHLFACESGCNSFRGNAPYTDFPDFGEAVRTSCGRREEAGFEPGTGKGPIARATLYFLIRYPGAIGHSELPRERLELLLSWHEAEPVGDYERHRNFAIAEIQGNRNPFIDHPRWAREIDFGEVWAA